MFVLLGPEFDATPESYLRLTQATGLVAYDLRARVRAGHWSVVKTLADASQADELARSLTVHGFRPILIERNVAHDPARRIVLARSVKLQQADFTLELKDRLMTIEYSALAAVVRGEVQPGRSPHRGPGSGPSSASLRAVNAQSEPLIRENQGLPFEAFQAADLHFLSVPWIARVDAQALGMASSELSLSQLDAFADDLARRGQVRVDRGVRTSSVATLAEQAGRAATESPLRDTRRELPDERFDPYSRLIGEAERQARAEP